MGSTTEVVEVVEAVEVIDGTAFTLDHFDRLDRLPYRSVSTADVSGVFPAAASSRTIVRIAPAATVPSETSRTTVFVPAVVNRTWIAPAARSKYADAVRGASAANVGAIAAMLAPGAVT